jgi:DNA-binding CsgD family transcriptional regulator
MRPTHLDTAYKYELSPKQREVLHLIARGRTNAEIAAELGISLDGAKYHVREILGKLEVESREEAAAKWRAMHSPAARMRALGGLLWHNFIWRAVAAVGVAGGLTSVIVVVLLARDGGPGLPAEATVVAPTSTATVASPTPSPRAAALLPDCTSAQAKLAVELIPAGDDVLIRMSVDGNQPCQLLGPASLRLLHPPTDPGPKYPPFANMERLLKIGLELPFSGVLGEWAWSNWCAPASAQIWDARAGAAGQYLEAQVSVDAFPKCVADGAPTVVHDPQRLSHVADSSAPSSICDKTTALWLCEVITNLNFDVASEGFAALERSLGSNETYYLCDGQAPLRGSGHPTSARARP